MYYAIDRTFPDYMRVMFNAEEIKWANEQGIEAPTNGKSVKTTQTTKFSTVPVTQRIQLDTQKE